MGRATVKKLVAWNDCHVALVPEGATPGPGEVWLEEENGRTWLVEVRACCPVGEEGNAVLVRPAERREIEAFREGQRIAEDRRRIAQREARAMKLPMRFVAAEQTLPGDFIRLFFLSHQRVDFRKLVRNLSRAFQARVELRQIGPRDAAKMVGGIGVCGRELCCNTFLGEFKSITLKMAFDQSLVIAPQRMTGPCGRLRCCLAYEHPFYRELLQGLPKVGKRVTAGEVEGRVVSYNIFRHTAVIEQRDGIKVEMPWDEVKPLSSPQVEPPRSGSSG
ncbi:TPA: stage 0 sporulation protein [Candidatus Micrarchaeota archaeon]|nr:stage 0 sporulation protein [Candidatus Micrarchaeota archaeon]